MKSNLEIAQEANLRPITEVAASIGLDEDEIETYGKYKAKISLSALEKRKQLPNGKYILVTAITPTPFGEGKTTTSIALTQGLGKLGKKAIVTLRQPSLGPIFGIKGGAAGAGYSQVVPMEDINLHFTGDIHAVGSAHNLLAAIIDNHLHRGNELGIDLHSIQFPRVVDMNDRPLRHIVIGLGGKSNGIPRETWFDITAASEVMAILALFTDLHDLKKRLGEILIGFTKDNKPVFAKDLGVHGAMAAILKDAVKPNLVQTLEGQPAIIHAGPFANIAVGTSSIIGDKLALKLADYVITEAGFATDLGAEKFFNIKCRYAELTPDAVVLVVTIRALKMHGGGFKVTLGKPLPKEEVEKENVSAVIQGTENMIAHIEHLKQYGVPIIVAINKFPSDTKAEIEAVKEIALKAGAFAVEVSEGVTRGGEGAIELAKAVMRATENPSKFQYLYDLSLPLKEKIQLIATKVYGAKGVEYSPKAEALLKQYEELGFGELPICMAKTHLSLSDNPSLKGRPTNFTIKIDDVRVSRGAGFVYPIMGRIFTMPGLSAKPAALQIDLKEDGTVQGIF